MTPYHAPLNDMKFLLRTFSTPAETTNRPSLSSEDAQEILLQAAHFIEQELAPINAEGDRAGCKLEGNNVLLMPKFKQALRAYAQAGWNGLSMPHEWGGQALPEVLAAKIAEMLTSANHAFSMITALSQSACKAIMAFGSEQIKQTYLPPLVTGDWTGTMCMTEAHCGSDLGLIRCAAEAADDGSYRISGSKLFISAGEHDGSDNIVHLVLARIKGAAEGTRGLSLFVVPKFDPVSGERNAVHCIGIEEKMGIHANPTCTMSFEGARGQLIGLANEGIKAMFTMMNEMRLGTALQGVGLSEHAFQKSIAYAKMRRQGQALKKPKAEVKQETAQLLQHPDIRRMLLTQRAFAEGGRALCHYCAQLLEVGEADSDAKREQASLKLGLLTPIAKAFLTETGLESASMAIQVYGGHGYIRETGVEQLYRDGRISTLYEGTTGIQALDLLGRKVLGDQAKTLLQFTKEINQFCSSLIEPQNMQENMQKSADKLPVYAANLKDHARLWPQLAQQVGIKALQDHEEVGAAAYDFLMYSGYVCLAYMWLRLADSARQINEAEQADFKREKLNSCDFYFQRLLPRAEAHRQIIQSGKLSLNAF